MPKEKIQLLVNTLTNSIAQFADKNNCEVTNLILDKISNNKKSNDNIPNIKDYINKTYFEYLKQSLEELKEKEMLEEDEKEIKKIKAGS